MKLILKIVAGLVILSVVLFVAATFYMGRNTYEMMNPVMSPSPYPTDQSIQSFHDSLFIADLHADTFNFITDFFKRNKTAHVDYPRLREGGISLMTMAIATEIPFSVVRRDPKGNVRGGNMVTVGAVSQFEPMKNWFSQYERGLYSLSYANKLISDNPDKLRLIRYKEDLQELIQAHAEDPENAPIGILFAVEGAHILEGNIERFDELYNNGVRMMSLTHAFDNEAGGSSEGVSKGGLTDYGKQLVERMIERGTIVDIAHASPALVDDLMARVQSPVVYSHGGVEAVCDIDRNLRQSALQKVKDNGGLIAVGFWPRVLCANSIESVASTMRYVADQIGVEHVALGSDFDGGVKVLFDASGIPLLTKALLENGFTREEIRLIMGENYSNLLLKSLPSKN